MEIRNLGKSGLRVSLVGLGCNNFGGRIDFDALDDNNEEPGFFTGLSLSCLPGASIMCLDSFACYNLQFSCSEQLRSVAA